MGSSSRRPVACGVDVGTTNAKVVLIGEDGAVLARAGRPTPRDAEGQWVDADALFAAIEEMVLEACGDDYEIHAICAAGVGEDGVLVDSASRPLSKALAWFDPRRHGVFRALRADLRDDEAFDAETDPVRTLVGWAWSRAELEGAGADVASARSWVALADLAGVRWSGRAFLSDTLASRTGAWRAADREWSAERVALTLGSADLLPPVVRTGDVVGAVDSPALRAAGVLASDAITVAGGHDHPIGGWGVDQLVPGAVLDSMGTAEVIVAQSLRPGLRRHEHVDVAPGIRSEGSTLLRVEELARNVEWASQDPEVAARIRLLLQGGVEPEPVLDAGYFVPGPRGGGRPSYSLDAPSDPLARASAVLGALAAVGRDAVLAVDRVAESAPHDDAARPREVRLAGGWARSPGWLEIKAAVTGRPTAVIAEPEVTAVGAALLAARARGWAPDPAVALGRL
ncbi:FGGY family carbohydrate kinase [Herbiconiux sp.]|uniref:FGGY-family carbohydrate kinase n=1 Tax=Herbiconiux sp. TaxID=1871186 RepID=UPI0025C32BF1|nr:FGGY family carbohydrate kinase [Herbiconiux sp.]